MKPELSAPAVPANVGLLLLSATLLTFAFAPYWQFYLAWIGLAPWLIVVGRTRSWLGAFGWGLLGGIFFNALTYTWLYTATVPGTLGLIVYISLFWACAAAIMRGARLVGVGSLQRFADPSPLPSPRVRGEGVKSAVRVLGVATVWTGFEWFRSWLFTGFSWMWLGQSQSPLIPMCQIADIGGVFAVTFWLVALNALVAELYSSFIIHHSSFPTALRKTAPAIATVSALLLALLIYGLFRLGQTDAHLTPGPRVMVVQPDHRHERGGRKLVSQDQQIDFHVRTTTAALEDARSSARRIDLVVWSETVMPPLNREVRHELRNEKSGRDLAQIDNTLRELARRFDTSLATGAYNVIGWKEVDGKRTGTDIRNAVFHYNRDGAPAPRAYDKMHLVPFAEILPFKESIPWLYAIFRYFAAYSVDYAINPAPWSRESLVVFETKFDTHQGPAPFRFVTPICFEDTDGALCAFKFRAQPSDLDAGRTKRADALVNITNDGWFAGRQKWQHLQLAIFRSIENRVPTARADNTGISGFIDSAGRVDWPNVLREGEQGTRDRPMSLDSRVTFYTLHGDVFGVGCFVLALIIACTSIVRWLVSRILRPRHTEPPAAALG